jgi:hypothetical protein
MYNTSLESMNNQTNFKYIDADDNDFFLTDDQCNSLIIYLKIDNGIL